MTARPVATRTVQALHVLAWLAAVAVPLAAIAHAIAVAASNPAQVAEYVNVPRWIATLGTTAVVTGTAVAVALPLALTLAILAVRTNLPGRHILLAALLFGACLPTYVQLVFFFSVVARDALTGNTLVCGTLYGVAYLPLVTLILAGVLRSADGTLEAAGRIDAPPPRVLWHITLPQARWGLIAATALLALLVSTDPSICDLLAVSTFAREVYYQYGLHGPQAGPTFAAAPYFILLAAALILLGRHLSRAGEQSPDRTPPQPYRLGALLPWAGLVNVLSLVAIFGGAIWVLVRRALHAPDVLATLANLQPELLTSVILSALGATAIILPAVGLAAGLTRHGLWRWILLVGTILLLATPAPVVGVSLIRLLNNAWLGELYDSPLAVAVGYFVRFLPVGILLVAPALRRIPTDLEDAARLDGGDWLDLLLRVRWPLVWRDAGLAWLVVWILAYAEIGTTVLLAAPGWPTASVEAFNLVHASVYHDLALLALVSAAYVLIPWAALLWILRARLQSARRTRPVS